MDVQGYEQGTLDLPVVSINYYRSGGGKPPLLFLHGVSDSGLCWKPTADVLIGHYEVFMIDARGHGLSKMKNKSKFRLTDLADDVAGLIKVLGLDRPVVVGHSMGAATAMMLARNYPELLNRVILSDPPVSFKKSSVIDLFRIVWGILNDIQAVKRKSPEKMMAYARRQNPKWSDEELIPWIESKKEFAANGGMKFFRNLNSSINYSAILKGITVKTALIHSSHGIVQPGDKDEFLSLNKNLQMFFVDDAGHCIRRDQPEKFRYAVNQFLSQE